MLVVRKRPPSFTNGRRTSGGSTVVPTKVISCHRASLSSSRSSKLFQPQTARVLVKREALMSGLTVPTSGIFKKFQRPMTKRRAYNADAEEALKRASFGQKKRIGGMSKIFERAGKSLDFKSSIRPANAENADDENDAEEAEEEAPYEPLQLWTSPHQGGELKGLPPRKVTELQLDEYGNQESVTVIKPAPLEAYRKINVFVPEVLAKRLRPHQREGVQFMYECVMGMKNFQGNGCILADDMGLGKTLQSVALIYTLLKTGITADRQPTAKRVIVVCPCSLVKNWANEFGKWLGKDAPKIEAIAEADRKKVESALDSFVQKGRVINPILIVSYECIRAHVGRLLKNPECCDLLVCDEAHRLKNGDSQTSKALNSLPVRRRVLLTGTPMQNDLQEFYAMVDFTNPGVLGTQDEFRRKVLLPILRGREPDATEEQKRRMMEIQNDMSSIVNEFILRRINTLNAEHLPPKLVQVVCCNLTEIQQNMYQHILSSKDMRHILEGKQVNCLGSIQTLMKLCNHPSLIVEDQAPVKQGRRAATNVGKYTDNEKEAVLTPGIEGLSKFLPLAGGGGRKGDFGPVHPEWSGKMFVLYRLMKEMRKAGNGGDKIVIISNYTQTLDLIGRMCRENSWNFCRLDGSITMNKRQKMVDEFNDPTSSLVAFLLSSKAGGCGLNLIGANRLVLFDPDWNPAVDKQAAARCWRDGQKKRCFTYRFLATGTVEEKIFQRQLSKEGLQSVVDDKEQVNALSTKDLRNLFKLRTGTPSDTHDKLRCERCNIISDDAEVEAVKALPAKLVACRQLLDKLSASEDAAFFLAPLVPQDFGVSKEEYEKLVKQPIDLGTIRSKLDLPIENASAYKSVSGFSKDVNRIFANVMKVWSAGDSIADAARRLQTWWLEQWTDLVPILMTMKASDVASEQHGTHLEGSDGFCVDICNERKEDYQEQIGMPDEENMRNWSHHYKVDTVDDPIFRAAMRGFDSVSFVFGLEVTWSLIQQRKQDEEDRKAMLELECLKELNVDVDQANPDREAEDEEVEFSMDDNLDGVDDEENAESEPDIGGGKGNDEQVGVLGDGDDDAVSDEEAEFSMGGDVADDKETEVPMGDDDVLVGNEGADLDSDEEAEFSMGEEGNEDGMGDNDSDEKRAGAVENSHARDIDEDEEFEFIDNNVVAAKEKANSEAVPTHNVAEAEPSAIPKKLANASVNLHSFVPTSSPSPKTKPLVKPGKENSPPPKSWACLVCTLENKLSNRKCDACGTKKPAAASNSGRKKRRIEATF